MFDISPIQIMIVLAIALLIFGPKRLPEMGRGLGKGLRDFKDGISGEAPVAQAAATAPAPAVTAAQAEPVPVASAASAEREAEPRT